LLPSSFYRSETVYDIEASRQFPFVDHELRFHPHGPLVHRTVSIGFDPISLLLLHSLDLHSRLQAIKMSDELHRCAESGNMEMVTQLASRIQAA
jgi:hypothetical protein